MKTAGQRWLCLEHSSDLSSLCKLGNRWEGLLFLRFESSTNNRWKTLKETFSDQRKSLTTLCNFVLLMSWLFSELQYGPSSSHVPDQPQRLCRVREDRQGYEHISILLFTRGRIQHTDCSHLI